MTSVAEKLRLAREKSKKRKELLGHTLGSGWAEELGTLSASKQSKTSSSSTSSSSNKSPTKGFDSDKNRPRKLSDHGDSKSSFSRTKRHSSEGVSEDNTEEFRDSTAFLKGTQSLNPHNDYSQNFVDTGQRPQNFIRKLYTSLLEIFLA